MITRFILALILCFSLITPALAAEGKESTWDRVMRTKTLRCGYTVYPPFFDKNLKTGAFEGMFYDFTNDIGKRLGLKVEWVAEVGYDMLFEGFGSGRYDAVCGGYADVTPRTMGGDFTKPIVYIPTYVFVRNDETRFTSLTDFNKPDAIIGTMDGEFSQLIAHQIFPNAKEFSVQGLTSASERMEMVAARKADFSPFEAPIGFKYMKANPGKVKKFGDVPLLVFGTSIIIPHNEFALKNMMDVAIDNMLYDGTIQRTIDKYIPDKGAALAPALPYQLPSGK